MELLLGTCDHHIGNSSAQCQGLVQAASVMETKESLVSWTDANSAVCFADVQHERTKALLSKVHTHASANIMQCRVQSLVGQNSGM